MPNRIDDGGVPLGVLMRKDLLDLSHPPDIDLVELLPKEPAMVGEDHTLREAADLMAETGTGMQVVVGEMRPIRMVGVLTRADVLEPLKHRLRQAHVASRHLY
jgi:chloride channel protein, CIC family